MDAVRTVVADRPPSRKCSKSHEVPKHEIRVREKGIVEGSKPAKRCCSKQLHDTHLKRVSRDVPNELVRDTVNSDSPSDSPANTAAPSPPAFQREAYLGFRELVQRKHGKGPVAVRQPNPVHSRICLLGHDKIFRWVRTGHLTPAPSHHLNRVYLRPP